MCRCCKCCATQYIILHHFKQFLKSCKYPSLYMTPIYGGVASYRGKGLSSKGGAQTQKRLSLELPLKIPEIAH
jgi:hypothetical protein